MSTDPGSPGRREDGGAGDQPSDRWFMSHLEELQDIQRLGVRRETSLLAPDDFDARAEEIASAADRVNRLVLPLRGAVETITRLLVLGAAACTLGATLAFFGLAYTHAWDKLHGYEPYLEPVESSMSLLVVSRPDQSQVIIDGVRRGRTPLIARVRCDPAARVVVAVHRAGHAPWVRAIPCEPRTKIEVQLKRK